MVSNTVKKRLSTIEQLERDLNLKQLQVNRLLNITQAINNNVKMSGLFEMYSSFLSWEMGVKKMALYFRKEDEWQCTASIGLDEKLLQTDISDQLTKFTRLNRAVDAAANIFHDARSFIRKKLLQRCFTKNRSCF